MADSSQVNYLGFGNGRSRDDCFGNKDLGVKKKMKDWSSPDKGPRMSEDWGTRACWKILSCASDGSGETGRTKRIGDAKEQ